MFPGVLALIGRSLRVDARSWQTHLARLGLMVAIYISLCSALWNARWFGAPGLRFFHGIAYLNVSFMTLLGISFFSTSITEEKEEDTLGLILMAGISPLGILIGKSGGRLFQALLLMAVQYPFTQLAVTMGGVSQTQIGAAFAGLSAYMILLAGFGALCSTISSNNRISGAWMILGILTYSFVPMFAANYLAHLARLRIGAGLIQSDPWLKVLDHISQFSVFNRLETILTTGFGETPWNWQVVGNSITGVACFGLAWALFGVCSRQPATESSTRGLVARGRGLLRWFSPGRVWENPFVWKDFYFVSGGVGMVPVRLVFCAGLWVVVFIQSQWNPPGLDTWDQTISFYQVLLALAVAIDASRVLAQSIQSEIRGQTLGALLMLPGSTLGAIYSKYAGALLGWIPGALIVFLVAILTEAGRRNFHSVLTDREGIMVCAFFLLIPHLTALLSLYLRWGAAPLGFALAYGVLMTVVLLLLNPSTGRPSHGAFAFIGFLMICICIGCHFVIVRRIYAIASR